MINDSSCVIHMNYFSKTAIWIQNLRSTFCQYFHLWTKVFHSYLSPSTVNLIYFNTALQGHVENTPMAWYLLSFLHHISLYHLSIAMQAPALRSLMCYIGVTYFNKPDRHLAIAMEAPVHLLPLNYNNVTEQRQK
jgi:hypothetical protein